MAMKTKSTRQCGQDPCEAGQDIQTVRISCAVDVPDLYKCERTMYTIRICLPYSMDSIKSYLASGNRDLDWPRFEPYYIPELHLNFAHARIRRMTLFNMNIYEVTNYKINNVVADDKVSMITFDAYFPRICMYARYDIEYLEHNRYFRISGDSINMRFWDVTATIDMDGIFYNNTNGEEMFRVSRVLIKFSVKDPQFYIYLSDEDDIKTISSLADYMNNNTEEMAEDIRFVVNTIVADIIKKTANSIYTKFPIKTLMPNYRLSDY
ncbi:hypothetical protein EAI_04921 [Harpegnathos saltator]|uniref:Uncharacterized protein n=1 Tax=Harpegnathos saltator TaxID=610380 RepID=E2BS96_HARSA|nr:hypothetical protein EAI_04921 [Harpegnathos saltator]